MGTTERIGHGLARMDTDWLTAEDAQEMSRGQGDKEKRGDWGKNRQDDTEMGRFGELKKRRNGDGEKRRLELLKGGNGDLETRRIKDRLSEIIFYLRLTICLNYLSCLLVDR